jgi:hypothetical protein
MGARFDVDPYREFVFGRHVLGRSAGSELCCGYILDPRRQAVAFEYLAYRADVVDAFEGADTSIYTFASCHADNGVVADTAVNDGTIETRTFGSWSDADRYTYDIHGSRSQLGYLVVRDKDFLVIVGFGNRGTLKLKTLEKLTEKALSKLPVT